jgi:hypothetical protein
MSNHMDMSNHKVPRICRIFEAPILYGYPYLCATGHGGGGGGSGTPGSGAPWPVATPCAALRGEARLRRGGGGFSFFNGMAMRI